MKDFVKKNWLTIILGLGVIAQLLSLIVFNITRLPYESNYDSSSAYAMIEQMWEQKNLILDYWGYQTTLGIDSPILIAAAVYGLCRNPFLAMGMANIITCILYGIIVSDILRQVNVKRNGILVTLIFLFTPYTTGQLGYTPMLFTSSGAYAYKMLVPLLLIDILVRLHQGKRSKINWLIVVALTGFSFLTAVSSGEYILLCGVLPVLVYEGIHILLGNDLRRIWNLKIGVVLLQVVVHIVGVVAGRNLSVLESKGASMSYVVASQLPENIEKCIIGIFQLFGGIESHDVVTIMNTYGFMYLFRLFMSVCIIASWIWLLKRVKVQEKYRDLTGIITCYFAVNMLVLMLANVNYGTDSFEYRYHLLTMVPMILTIGPVFDELTEKRLLFYNAILFAAIGCAFLVNYYGYRNYMKEDYSGYETLQEICADVEDGDCPVLYTLGEEVVPQGRKLRCISNKIDVTVWHRYNLALSWGESSYYHDASRYDGPIMVLTTKKHYDTEVPKYLREQMKYVNEYVAEDITCQLYYVEKNIFDGTVNFSATDDVMTDYFYSKGYTYNGKVDKEWYIKKADDATNIIKSSKIKPIAGTYSYTINYDIPDDKTEATFIIKDNEGNVICKQKLDNGKNQIVLKDVQIAENDKWIRYYFKGNKNAKIRLDAITVQRQ